MRKDWLRLGFAILVAALLWFYMFSPWTHGAPNFWIVMSFSAVALMSLGLGFTSVVIRSAFSFSLSDALPIATLIQPSSPNIERSLSESPNTIASSHLPPKRSRMRCIPAPLSDGSTNMYSWWKRHQGSSLRDSSDSSTG